MQLVPLQQPLQVVESQPLPVLQAPLTQVPPFCAQSTHSIPPVPQVALARPPRHCPDLQQPEQLVGSQEVPPRQTPLMQDWPVLQATQGNPAPPQAVVVGGAMQSPPRQQPWQLPGPQEPEPSWVGKGGVLGSSPQPAAIAKAATRIHAVSAVRLVRMSRSYR